MWPADASWRGVLPGALTLGSGPGAARRRLALRVEAAARLPPQPAGLDELPEGLRRPEPVAVGRGHRVGDQQDRVEPDVVGELERAHGVVQAQLHGRVDVLAARRSEERRVGTRGTI